MVKGPTRTCSDGSTCSDGRDSVTEMARTIFVTRVVPSFSMSNARVANGSLSSSDAGTRRMFCTFTAFSGAAARARDAAPKTAHVNAVAIRDAELRLIGGPQYTQHPPPRQEL